MFPCSYIIEALLSDGDKKAKRLRQPPTKSFIDGLDEYI